MSLVCAVRGHRPSSETIHNGGWNFGRCMRCAVDLVERDGVWGPAPKGCRVVWKPIGADVRPLPPPAQAEPIVADAKPVDAPPQEQPIVADARPVEAPPQEQPAPPGFEEQRDGVDRRAPLPNTLPQFLGGKERRRRLNRRKGFGRKPVNPNLGAG